MSDRSYAQFCALAKALDIIGERWTLLIVRELLVGPKRYTDLIAGLPGISTDMLAARLRNLEKSGVLVRRALPPPAASTVYELTDFGRELEPAVLALARWGLRVLTSMKRDETFRIEWLELNLRMMLQPEHACGAHLTIEFQIADDRLQVRIADGSLQTLAGAPEQPDVTVASDPVTLAEIARDRTSVRRLAKGRLRVSGRPEAIERMNLVLGLSSPSAKPAR